MPAYMQLTVRLLPHEYEQLEELADAEERSLAYIARQGVRRMLDGGDQPDPVPARRTKAVRA